MSTYDGYPRAYYEKNKKRILARTRRYRRAYSKKYYEENRASILAKLQNDRDDKKIQKNLLTQRLRIELEKRA